MDWLNNLAKKYPLWTFIGVGVLLYFYSLFNGFVGDDFDQLVNNSFVHALSNIPYFFLGGTFNNGFVSLSGIYYKPMMTIIYSLLYTLFQATPFFYHLTQLVLHIANTILLFYLMRKFFSPLSSFIAALIFLIHPMNTEAVSYISNLQDVLFTFFGLGALLLLMYKKQSRKNICIASVLLLLSLFSKETGIVFVSLSLLYQFLYQRNYFLPSLIAALVTVGIYFGIRIHAVGLYKYQTENFPMMQLSLLERLLHIPQILLYYVKTFLFPINLAFAQNWIIKELSLTTFFLPLLLIVIVMACIGMLGWYLRSHKEHFKQYVFFLGTIILGLSLHLQLLPLDMTVADRWFYVPFIGVIGLLTLGAHQLTFFEKRKQILPYVLIGLFSVLFCLTFARSRNWESQYTLYGHDVKYNTTSYNLLNGWASELMNVGKYAEAEPFIRRSIELQPDFCYSWNNLGSVYAIRKDYKKARVYYETAIKRRACPLAYNNLATLMYYHFDTEEAFQFTTKAIKEVPNSPRLWLMLAVIEHKRGNDEKALNAAKRSYQLSPSSGAAYVYTSLLNKQSFDLKEN